MLARALGACPAGRSSGSGCGRRWPRSRPRSGCSWRCPGSDFGCRCRRSAAPSGCSRSSCWRWRRPCRCSMVRMPIAIEGLRRLDRDSLLPHRPATAIADRMAPEAGDSVRGRAVARACGACAARGARAEGRHADAAACRARSVCAARAGADSGGRDVLRRRRRSHRRVAAAFDWHGVVSPANYRIDAWVTPPAYTGRPPLILPGLRPGEQSQARANGPVTVPAGSTLVVRATGESGLDVAVSGGIAEAAGRCAARRRPRAPRSAASPSPPPAPPRCAAAATTWSGPSTPSRIAPPTIALAKEPERQLRGSLLLQLQDRGRLRRGRRAGDVRAQAAVTASRLDRDQAAAPAVRRAQFHRWCCRRRAPATASARPPRICPSIPGPASTWR